MTRRAMTAGLTLLALLGVTAAVYFYIEELGDDERLLKPDDRVVVAAGAEIYSEHCASCHGVNLEGEPDWQRRKPDGKLPAPPHDESGHTWHHDEATLFAITKYGTAKAANLAGYQSDMPIYDDVLTDSDIIAVLSFIKSTWPAAIREGHDGLAHN